MNVAFFYLKIDYGSLKRFINVVRFTYPTTWEVENMPLWGWLLVFFGGLLLVGFIADRISQKNHSTDSRKIQKQVEEIKNNQRDYHHFL